MSLDKVDRPATESAPPTALRERLQRALAMRYALGTEVGRGGMGAVYVARDLALDRPVAIKVLPPEFAAQADRRERFLRETRTTASFSHPHIVPVHAVEECDGLLCFVMSYVDGETLAQRVRRAGPLPSAEAIRVLREVAWALAYAHGRGVVHRDVKPDNILLERSTGRALVTDFGIARTDVGGLTQAGEVIGTPQYMSPEQAAGEPTDGRSDLYALGAVAFFALTGHPPFDGDSTAAILAMHLTRQPPPVASARQDIPSQLSDTVDRLLAKEPGDRFLNGEALVDALDAMQAAHPEVPPPIRLFQLRAATSARNALVIALFAPYIVTGVRGSADRIVALVLCVTAFVAIVFPIPATLRDLARRGFRFDDLREGLLAIEAEQAAVRGPLRRRRLLAAAGVLLLGLVIIAVALRLREPLAGGGFRASNTVLFLMLAGVATSIAALAATLVEGRVLVALDRLPRMTWTSRAGRWLFAAANAGARGAPPASSAARSVTLGGDRGPLTVFEGLPKPEQRRLRDVATTLRELDAVDRAIAERLGRIISVLAELGAQQPRTEENTARSVEGSSLHDELTTAKSEAEGRRERIAALRDAARVELLRYKAGLASEERVRQTVQEARVQLATLGAPSPSIATRHLALIALLGALAAWPSVAAQSSVVSSRVNEATLREVAVRLASRDLEGRAAGERGGDRAALFIAERFAALGVRPLGDGASFLQRVPLRRERLCDCAALRIGALTLRAGKDFVSVPDSADVAGHLFLVTSALADLPNDDRLRGAIVAIVLGDTGLAEGLARARGAGGELRATLMRRGARAIVIAGAGDSWVGLADRVARPRLRAVDAGSAGRRKLQPTIVLSDSAAAALAVSAGLSLDSLRAAARRGLAPVNDLGEASLSLRVTRDTVIASNVVGVIPGTDSVLGREAVIVSAHYDAFGVGRSGRVSAGAADNAVGVGILVAVAEAMSRAPVPPRRAVVLLAVTGEEHGLLGSRHYVQHPRWPLDASVANLNVDGIGMELLGPVRAVVAYGAEYSDLGTTLRAAASRDGIALAPDPFPDERPFEHSDQFAFAQAGVPSLMLLGLPDVRPEPARSRTRTWLATAYHEPGDTVRADWHWEGARAVGDIVLRVATDVADADDKPSWALTAPFRRGPLIAGAASVLAAGFVIATLLRRRWRRRRRVPATSTPRWIPVSIR